MLIAIKLLFSQQADFTYEFDLMGYSALMQIDDLYFVQYVCIVGDVVCATKVILTKACLFDTHCCDVVCARSMLTKACLFDTNCDVVCVDKSLLVQLLVSVLGINCSFLAFPA